MPPLAPDVVAEMIETRRNVHRHPELAFEEHRTAGIVAARLRRLGLDVEQGVGGTGVVATMRGNGSGPALLLRAEMDALPLLELAAVPFASEVDGVMHACGHDAHTAMLLAVAHELVRVRDQIPGMVRFLFQPAEEVGAGAASMLAASVMDDVAFDGVLALHMHAHIPAGVVGVCRGAAAANVAEFEVTVTGKGGHGAFPHAAVDAVLTAAQITTALQTLVPREISALDRAVLTVGQIHAGTAFNIMPETAVLGGTIRTATDAVAEHLARRMADLSEGIARSMRCTTSVRHRELIPPVRNDDALGALVRSTASDVAGASTASDADPVMAGDDVALFMDRAPGCYFFVGAAHTDGRPQTPHHSPIWDMDERAMELGANVLLEASRRFLGVR
ncbi:MAG: M20 metallopeptidase family protein [Acidimicrobiales bacterium]